MTAVDDGDARVDFAGIQALSSRTAGYAVAQKCLQVQADAEARDPSLKTASGVTLADDARSWYVGALGEIEVGEMLKALGPEWFVRHAVPIGAGTKDVDHLVIGPGGVFAINTKHHAGASIWVGDVMLRVNNSNKRYLMQGRSDGQDVAKRLTEKVGFPVRITSVLAILGATSIVDKRDANNRPVSVVDADNLVAWLLARPPQLGETTLSLIKLAAEEPETWHVDPRAADTLRVMQRFERLVDQVGMPGAPPARPSRTKPTASGPRRQKPGRPVSAPTRMRARSGRGTGPGFGALLKLWFATGIVLVAIIVFRSIANQPCTTGICLVPLFYQGLKPLLVLGVIASIGIGAIGTLIWIVRRAANR